MDKYNLIYIYPIDFESKGLYRRSLVIYSILGILLFQLEMFLISGSVLSKRVNIYLFAFLVIQSMIVFTVFEFIRKPWEGKEHAATLALQQQANNLFDSISSYHTNNNANETENEKSALTAAGANAEGADSATEKRDDSKNKSTQNRNLPETYNEKILILRAAYENPLDEYF